MFDSFIDRKNIIFNWIFFKNVIEIISQCFKNVFFFFFDRYAIAVDIEFYR